MSRPTSHRQSAPRSGVGSQSAWRLRNIESLLEDLRVNGPATQRQLAERTGFSTATISNLVNILRADHRVRTQSVISSGRRAVLVDSSEVESKNVTIRASSGL
ncbi:winged helix-turn-helix transcriptional regulator [Arthrobacter sp. NPDC058130]|uniref:winged helix-turn-helix transcriptional regulator n=1 Tax=Arthrobacter sp. NPDC058130 TaxID=3346353 RepID=UPI0036ECD21D